MLKKQTLIAFCPYDCVCVYEHIFSMDRTFIRSFVPKCVAPTTHNIAPCIAYSMWCAPLFFAVQFCVLAVFRYLFHRVQHTNCKQATTCVHRALSLQYWIHSRNTHIVYEDIFTQFNVFASFRVRYYLVQCVYFFRFLMDL